MSFQARNDKCPQQESICQNNRILVGASHWLARFAMPCHSLLRVTNLKLLRARSVGDSQSRPYRECATAGDLVGRPYTFCVTASSSRLAATTHCATISRGQSDTANRAPNEKPLLQRRSSDQPRRPGIVRDGRRPALDLPAWSCRSTPVCRSRLSVRQPGRSADHPRPLHLPHVVFAGHRPRIPGHSTVGRRAPSRERSPPHLADGLRSLASLPRHADGRLDPR